MIIRCHRRRSARALEAGGSAFADADMLSVGALKWISISNTGPVQAGVSVSFTITESIAPFQNSFNPIAPWSAVGLTTARVVSPFPGVLYKIMCDNIAGSAAAYVQFLNTGTSPVVGTTVVGYVPLGFGNVSAAVTHWEFNPGLYFPAGLSLGAATTPGGATVVSTAVNCSYAYQ